MTLQLSPTVEQLILEKMASGHYSSAEELLVEALQSLDDCNEELRAIEEGLASLDRGETGLPLDEAFARLRQKHQIRNE